MSNPIVFPGDNTTAMDMGRAGVRGEAFSLGVGHSDCRGMNGSAAIIAGTCV